MCSRMARTMAAWREPGCSCALGTTLASGWHTKLPPDATFEVTVPNGQVRATSPPRAEPGW